MVLAAVAVAEEGTAAGELPIGAVVALGDDIVAQAFTQERGQGRRLVHADLLAMLQADELLGWRTREQPLYLAVNLEPCLMCLGAAMTLGIDTVYFGIESPADGAASIAADWNPAGHDLPCYRPPAVTGGIRRPECLDQFRRYCATVPDSGYRRWAQSIVDRCG
jgi:tRNA(adenine34) deaminase